MATIYEWQKYINLLHELALVEDDLRAARVGAERGIRAAEFAERVLYERFGG